SRAIASAVGNPIGRRNTSGRLLLCSTSFSVALGPYTLSQRSTSQRGCEPQLERYCTTSRPCGGSSSASLRRNDCSTPFTRPVAPRPAMLFVISTACDTAAYAGTAFISSSWYAP